MGEGTLRSRGTDGGVPVQCSRSRPTQVGKKATAATETGLIVSRFGTQQLGMPSNCFFPRQKLPASQNQLDTKSAGGEGGTLPLIPFAKGLVGCQGARCFS
uniref:Uncharacterized protein n=1 Tax=Micrurus lemniscatus lemniscatus TaxID=129467 RepID=A0A2D4HZY8_MICLE